MKIVKRVKKRARLLSLNALETKISCPKKKHSHNVLIKNIGFKFKNALNIIFKFHSENKKILFLGTPLKLTKQLKELFKNTNHSFVPEKIWLGGILTNTKSIFKFLFKKNLKKNRNYLKFLFCLTVKTNLIIILNESLSTNFLKELSKTPIPTISLNYNNTNIDSYSTTYRIKQNLNDIENKSIKNLFFSILSTIFKKAEKVRVKTIKINSYLKQIKLRRDKKLYNKFYRKSKNKFYQKSKNKFYQKFNKKKCIFQKKVDLNLYLNK